jgi:hypothetical protein
VKFFSTDPLGQLLREAGGGHLRFSRVARFSVLAGSMVAIIENSHSPP